MRVLLVHPEDSPRRGPWSRQRWDLIVDLGKSSQFSAETWEQQYGCPVLRADSFREGIADARLVRDIFSAGRGRLIDEEGIDWWDLTSLLLVTDALSVLVLRRVAGEISPSAEIWATRVGGPASILAVLRQSSLRSLEGGRLARSAARAMHYAGLSRRFSAIQIKEIFLDKYDSGFRWRSRFAGRVKSCSDPVVLLPSAYGNVSRMAAAYARLLPQQSFLMVTTRRSAGQFVPPANVQVRDLANYGTADASMPEVASLVERWMKLRAELHSLSELHVLSRVGLLDPLPGWIRDGLSARDAWRGFLDNEPVCSVLCGDDSNRFTRLPVLLAARRGIPTVDFHHGAFDGRYLLKDLPCDVYLAKNEMERDYLLRVCGLPAEKVVIGAPSPGVVPLRDGPKRPEGASVILFSEPYEIAGMRVEEVYRELLPPLWRVAREQGRGLVIKLHPFESRSQRSRIVRDILPSVDSRLVSVVDGPITGDLMSQAWFGITVESTSVMDCLQNGVPCFLCGWLALSPYGYVEQYGRFGVGEILQNAEGIGGIPSRLSRLKHGPSQSSLARVVDPAMLQRWLRSGLRERSGARSVS